MPLQKSHEIFVTNLIADLLLDLPTEKAQLLRKASQIRQLLAEASAHDSLLKPRTMKETESTDEYSLFLCMADPETQFKKLENEDHDKAFFVADVQMFIVNYVFSLLKKAAENCQPPLAIAELQWNSKELWLDLETKKSASTFFQTKKTIDIQDAGDYSWDLNYTPGLLYTAKIYFTHNELHATHVSLQVTITIPGREENIVRQVPKFHIIPGDLTDETEIAFHLSTKNLAIKRAQEIATKIILENFYKNRIKPKLNWDALPLIYLLILNPFYYDLFSKNQFQPTDYLHLPLIQLRTLSTPAIINLLKTKKLDLDTATKITIPQFQLLKIIYYNDKVINGTINLNEILNLAKATAQVLVLPAVINLQLRGILSFEQAKKINLFTAQLLCIQFYFDQIIDEAALQTLTCETEQERDNLSHENTIMLITLEKIPLSVAKALSPAKMRFISDDILFHQFLRGKISLTDIQELTDERAEFIFARRNFLKKDSVTLADLSALPADPGENLIYLFLHDILCKEKIIATTPKIAELLEATPDTLTLLKCHPNNIHYISAFIAQRDELLKQFGETVQQIKMKKLKNKKKVCLINAALIQNLIATTAELVFSTDDWLDLLIKNTLRMIPRLIQKQDNPALKAPAFFNNLCHLIDNAIKLDYEEKSISAIHAHWQSALNETIKIASPKLSKPATSQLTFFTAAKTKNNPDIHPIQGVKDVCDNIILAAECLKSLQVIATQTRKSYRP